MKSQKQILGENSVILILSTIIVKIIGAVFKIPLASDKFLGDIGFGYFSVAHDLFMPFYVLAISGLPVAISHLTAQNLAKKHYYAVKNDFYKAKKLFLVLGVCFSLLVCALSVPIVTASVSGKNSLYSIIAVVPSIFLCFIISVYRGYFEGFNNMYPTAVSKIIEALFKLILGLLFAFLVIKKTSNPALAAAAAMAAVSVGTLISTLYLHLKFKHNNPLTNLSVGESGGGASLTFKTLLILAIPFALSSLASSLVGLIDVFTVKLQIANANDNYFSFLANQNINGDISAYLYGIRSKAFTLFNLVPTITMSLGVGALPVLTHINTADNQSNLNNNISYTLKLITTVTMPAGIGLAVLSHCIMNLLYVANNALEGNILAIYGIAAIFAGVAVPLTNVLQSIGLHYKALKHIVFALLIKVISNTLLALIPAFNIYSVAFGTLLCYLYLFISFLCIIKKEIKALSVKDTIFKPLLASALCGVSAFLFALISASSIITLLAILIAVIVYFASIIILKTFSKDEILALPLLNKFANNKNTTISK